MRWLYKSAILTLGRFGPMAVIYSFGALHYKTNMVAAYALALNVGQIAAQLSECGLSARLARVTSGGTVRIWGAFSWRFLCLAGVFGTALAAGWAPLIDAPVAFGSLMLIVARDMAVILRDVQILSMDAVCGVLSLVAFAWLGDSEHLLWAVGTIYTAVGIAIFLHLLSLEQGWRGSRSTDEKLNCALVRSDWASYINRVIGLSVSAFDLQIIARSGLGDAALTRYIAAKTIFRAGSVLSAYAQALVGARVDLFHRILRYQTALLRLMLMVLVCQAVVLVAAYDQHQETWHLIADFLLSAAWAVIYSVYAPSFMKLAMNQIILIAALLSNAMGFAIMLITSRTWGVAGVAFGFAVQSMLFCHLVVRRAPHVASVRTQTS